MRRIDVLPWIIAERVCLMLTAVVYMLDRKMLNCLTISADEVMIQ